MTQPSQTQRLFIDPQRLLKLKKDSLMTQPYQAQRIYIDPQRLLKLKKERKPFKQVASVFEPPPEIQPTKPETTPIVQRQATLNPHKQNQLLRSQVLVKSKHPNVDFIVGCIGEIRAEQIVELQEGDCLSMRSEERWLLLEGQVRITGVGGHVFCLKEGCIMFINVETRSKIKQVICLRGCRVMKISKEVFQRMRNYIFLKNAEKIKYIKYCPFFIWTDKLSEDLAACMYMEVYEKGEQIYFRGDLAQKILFVKEGVVLLERSSPLTNQVLTQYENHYQRSQISQTETTLVVKKGMVFGIDGILLKDTFTQSSSKEGLNPQSQDKVEKQQTRVYSARTLGRTEVYVLQKQLLQGLFDVHDLLSSNNFSRELTKGDLQKICSDYAQMVVRHRSLPKIVQSVMSKQLTLDKLEANKQQLLQKKTKVRQVRQQQQLTKRHSIAKIISDCKHYRMEDINNSVVLQRHFNQKLGLDRQEEDSSAFPALSSHLKKRTAKQSKRSQQADRFIMQWVRASDQKQSKEKMLKPSAIKKSNKLSLINIKSYRSIIPNIN